MQFISSNKSALFIALILITGLCFGQSKDRSKPPVPTNGQQHQNEGNRKEAKIKGPQTNPLKTPVTIEGPVTEVRQLSADEQAEKAQEKSKDVWNKFIDDVLLSPQQWINVGLLILAGLAARYSYGAYKATKEQVKIANEQFLLEKIALSVATSPKLSVDAVRAANFYVGMEPVFFVKVLNSGPAVAEAVKVSIRVESGVGGSKYTSDDQIMTVPANSSREYPIRWPMELTQAALDGFSSSGLEVKGNFEYGGKSESYCYKYYPWKGTRPEGVPQFIPCKFNPRLTLLVPIGGVESTSAVGTLTPIQSKAPPDT